MEITKTRDNFEKIGLSSAEEEGVMDVGPPTSSNVEISFCLRREAAPEKFVSIGRALSVEGEE